MPISRSRRLAGSPPSWLSHSLFAEVKLRRLSIWLVDCPRDSGSGVPDMSGPKAWIRRGETGKESVGARTDAGDLALHSLHTGQHEYRNQLRAVISLGAGDAGAIGVASAPVNSSLARPSSPEISGFYSKNPYNLPPDTGLGTGFNAGWSQEGT
jgi:hypothetical protein